MQAVRAIVLTTRALVLGPTCTVVDHRVIVRRGAKKQTQLAERPRIDDIVFCSADEKKPLDAAQMTKKVIDIVEVTFKPDKAVQVWELNVDLSPARTLVRGSWLLLFWIHISARIIVRGSRALYLA